MTCNPMSPLLFMLLSPWRWRRCSALGFCIAGGDCILLRCYTYTQTLDSFTTLWPGIHQRVSSTMASTKRLLCSGRIWRLDAMRSNLPCSGTRRLGDMYLTSDLVTAPVSTRRLHGGLHQVPK